MMQENRKQSGGGLAAKRGLADDLLAGDQQDDHKETPQGSKMNSSHQRQIGPEMVKQKQYYLEQISSDTMKKSNHKNKKHTREERTYKLNVENLRKIHELGTKAQQLSSSFSLSSKTELHKKRMMRV